MAQKKRRVPRRTATRPAAALRVVPEQPPEVAPWPWPGAGLEVPPSRAAAAGVAGSLMGALDSVRHRMDADLVIASILRTITAGFGPQTDDLTRVEAPALLLQELVLNCQDNPGPRTLGLVSLLSDQGPAHVRAQAHQVAQELAAEGIVPPRWAAPVPIRVVRAWMYGDVDGSQSSYGMGLSYGHRDHALVVLIDHRLGGGIKDVWFDFGDDGRRIREKTQRGTASDPRAFFEDLTAEEALDGIQKAMACPPCPEQPDQIDDVNGYLYLAHTRVRQVAAQLGQSQEPLWSDLLWSEAQTGGASAQDEAQAVAEHQIYRLKVTLAGSKPPRWRRLEVSGDTLLPDLQAILATAFGQDAGGPYDFAIGSGRQLRPVHEDDLAGTALFSLVDAEGDKATYTVGAGRHQILLEQTLAQQPGEQYPRCTAGRGAPTSGSVTLDLDAVTRDLQRLEPVATPEQEPLEQLVSRSGDLKVALVSFAQQQRFRRALSAAVQNSGPMDDLESDSIEFMEYFMLRHRFEDGQTLVEKFAHERTDLPAAERYMLLGWADPIEEVLQVERIEGPSLVATSLFNDLTYRVRSNMGVQVFRQTPPGSFIVLKLVPVLDEWLVSGNIVPFAAEGAQDVYAFAARQAMNHPALTFRNPENLQAAWEMQRRDRGAFIAFFDSPVVILPGAECRRQFAAFRRSQQHDIPDQVLNNFQLPATPHPIAMIYDEVEGLGFFIEFEAFLAGFGSPEQVDQKAHAELVLSYLSDDTTGGAPFRACAERNPTTVDAVLARILERPGFSWERQGEALLAEFKPWLADRQPHTVLLPPRLAAFVAEHGLG